MECASQIVSSNNSVITPTSEHKSFDAKIMTFLNSDENLGKKSLVLLNFSCENVA